MPQINLYARIDGTIRLDLNFEEAAALDALAGYGVDSFLEVFYKHLGRAYLEPHERALRTLFEKVSVDVPHFLHKIREANDVFTGMKVAVYKEPTSKTNMTAKDLIKS